MSLSPQIRARMLQYQKTEITEHHIYRRLARSVKTDANRGILRRIAADERRHYGEWKAYTGQEVEPDRFQVLKYYWISRILGFTFGVKLMERGEAGAQENYGDMSP